MTLGNICWCYVSRLITCSSSDHRHLTDHGLVNVKCGKQKENIGMRSMQRVIFMLGGLRWDTVYLMFSFLYQKKA